MAGPGAVRSLGPDAAPAVIELLSDAFGDYPVMRYVLGPRRSDDPHRIRALIGLVVMARVLRGEAVFGIEADGQLVAAALVSHPDGGPPPPEFGTLRARVWSELGAEAYGRYEAFGAGAGPLIAPVPRVHLNMIGVRPRVRGRGLARPLLERVHAYSRETPGARGVSLTTEDPRNLSLYEHFGYRVTGRARIAPELETWALFREESGQPLGSSSPTSP